MSVFTMVVWIVGIATVGHLIERSLKYRAEQRTTEAVDDSAVSRLQELEGRIRVLERIVTENKFDLKNEIDRL